jgi:hypothetical protein
VRCDQGDLLGCIERRCEAYHLIAEPGALKRIGGAAVDPAHQGGEGIKALIRQGSHGIVLVKKGSWGSEVDKEAGMLKERIG